MNEAQAEKEMSEMARPSLLQVTFVTQLTKPGKIVSVRQIVKQWATSSMILFVMTLAANTIQTNSSQLPKLFGYILGMGLLFSMQLALLEIGFDYVGWKKLLPVGFGAVAATYLTPAVKIDIVLEFILFFNAIATGTLIFLIIEIVEKCKQTKNVIQLTEGLSEHNIQ